LFVRNQTEAERAGPNGADFVGVPQLRVVSEILESLEDLTSIEMLEAERAKVNKVIKRLIDQEQILLSVDPPQG